jgi:hypothetical protein
LKHFSKSYEANQKKKKKKNQNKKGERKAATGPTREPDQPRSHRTSPPATLSSPPFPFTFLYFIFYADGRDPPVSIIFSNGYSSLETDEPENLSPLKSSLPPALIDA